MNRRFLALPLLAAALGLSVLASVEAAAQTSIGLPPSMREESAAPAGAAKTKKPGRAKKSGEGSPSGSSAAGPNSAQARKGQDARLRRPDADESVSSSGGLPRLAPSFDASSGRLGLGGKF